MPALFGCLHVRAHVVVRTTEVDDRTHFTHASNGGARFYLSIFPSIDLYIIIINKMMKLLLLLYYFLFFYDDMMTTFIYT